MDSMLFLMMLACSVTGAPPALFPLQPVNMLDVYQPERGQLENPALDGLSDDKLEELEETLSELIRSGEEPPIIFIDEDSDGFRMDEEPMGAFPIPEGFLPLSPQIFTSPDGVLELDNDDDLMALPRKRSRYYRRYTGKRQTKYYNPDTYLCSPTKEDVYRLLAALHEVRNGTMDKTVHFCNRRRPAKAVFTNIRFLGKRR